MSGFAGFTGPVENGTDVLKNMLEKIIHRGPDSSGTYSDGFLSAGFCRLNTITNEIGGDPIRNEDGSLLLFSDAVVYNHRALRDELTEKGHAFYTVSDTEVILHLYEEYGPGMLGRIRGMFSFMIYDKNDGSLFFARDPFGVKPLYYCGLERGLAFASEIKGLAAHPLFKKELNEAALECYLSFQYSVLPETFFKGVFRLPPGCRMSYKNDSVAIEKYFNAEFDPDDSIGMDAAAEFIGAAVDESIKTHTAGDVEVGSLLSSGVDSSYLAARFSGSKTFTVGFGRSGFNETDLAAPFSESINKKNYSRTITPDEYFDILPKVMYHMDEPLADPSAVALYFVSELAASRVKVALSGEAVDEFFGGYNIYKECVDLRALTSLPRFVRRALAAVAGAAPFSFKGKNFFIRGAKTVEERFIGNANIFTQHEIKRLLKNPSGMIAPPDITKPVYDMSKDLDDVTKMQLIDINLWMPGDILLKADRMSAAHSLEVRSPYLDSEIFKLASKIPSRLKVSRAGTKLAFRAAAAKHLPPETAGKKKLGFPVPIRIWLKDERFYTKIKAAFISEAAGKYFITDELIGLLDAHFSGKRDTSRRIWTIYIFLIWYEQFFG